MGIWQLTAEYGGVTARGLMNGFPVLVTDASGDPGCMTAPLNAFLIGKGNLLKFEITERRPGAELNARVEAVEPGDIVATGGAGQVSLNKLEYKFDTEEDDFAELLQAAQPATAPAMTEFALRLRDLLNGRKRIEVLTLLTPKLAALAGIFGVPMEMIEEQVNEVIGELSGAKHKFEAADVNAVPCCGNKLWQLLDNRGQPLLRVQTEDGGTLSLDIVAAKLPEGIRIVR